jgi:hypothetical protein
VFSAEESPSPFYEGVNYSLIIQWSMRDRQKNTFKSTQNLHTSKLPDTLFEIAVYPQWKPTTAAV